MVEDIDIQILLENLETPSSEMDLSDIDWRPDAAFNEWNGKTERFMILLEPSCIPVLDTDVSNYFADIKFLNKGSYGKVYSGTSKELAVGNIPNIPRTVAIKAINRRRVDDERLNNEIRILRKLISEYTIKYYACFKSPGNIYLITELIEGRDLFEVINAGELRIGGEPEKNLKRDICRKLALGIRDLHSVGIVHRDLKSENVMYNPATGVLKIIDYGLSCLKHVIVDQEGKEDVLNLGVCEGRMVGTPGYMYPKLTDTTNVEQLKSADWWAYGQIVIIIISNGYSLWRRNKYMSMDEYPGINRIVNSYNTTEKTILNRMTNLALQQPSQDEILGVFASQ